MGLTPHGTFFVFVLMAIKSPMVTASIDVGATCSPSDTCVTGAICDKVHEKCLLQAGGTCAETDKNCVSGADCESKTCTCRDGYTEEIDKTCKPKTTGSVGSGCTPGESSCTTPNSECSALGACKCKTGYVLNIDTGKCDGTVGAVCSTGHTCVTSSVCDKVAGKCLLEAGETCTETDKNCVSGAACESKTCTCRDGYTKEIDKTCKPKTTGSVGSGCTPGESSCTTPNSECSALGACKFKTGYVLNIDTGKCDGTVGAACSTGHTCVTSSVCDKVAGKCLLKAEQTCTGDNQDNCLSGAVCKTNGCECGSGYTTDNDKVCKPKNVGTVGTTCTSEGSECTTPNSQCSSLGACKCQIGFLLNIANGQCSKGSAAGQVSIWLLAGTLMAVKMATYVA